MYLFDWTSFPQEVYVQFSNALRQAVENDNPQLVLERMDDLIGVVRVGEICIEFVFRDGCSLDDSFLDALCYVGGVDTGYGYKKNGYPYDLLFAPFYGNEGLPVSITEIADGMSYREFKKAVERYHSALFDGEGDRSGWEYSLVEKASANLHLW